MLVTLSASEIRFAAQVGAARRTESLLAKYERPVISSRGDWQMDILGAIGEMAVAKALNVYWTPSVNTFKLPDIGTLNVRATEHNNGRLLLRPGDPPGIYVLVVVRKAECNVAGWIESDLARNAMYQSRPDLDGPLCWAVPMADLHPIETLREYSRETSPAKV